MGDMLDKNDWYGTRTISKSGRTHVYEFTLENEHDETLRKESQITANPRWKIQTLHDQNASGRPVKKVKMTNKDGLAGAGV